MNSISREVPEQDCFVTPGMPVSSALFLYIINYVALYQTFFLAGIGRSASEIQILNDICTNLPHCQLLSQSQKASIATVVMAVDVPCERSYQSVPRA